MADSKRMCVACRERLPREELIRIVKAPDGSVVVDHRGRLPGRGVWLHPSASCVEKLATRKGLLKKGLDIGGTLDVRPMLEEQLVRAAMDGLSMAAAAGALVSGNAMLQQALKDGRIHWVVVANDASERTLSGLAELGEEVKFVTLPVSRDALGHHIGKGARAAVGVTSSRAASHLRRQLRRIRSLG